MYITIPYLLRLYMDAGALLPVADGTGYTIRTSIRLLNSAAGPVAARIFPGEASQHYECV